MSDPISQFLTLGVPQKGCSDQCGGTWGRTQLGSDRLSRIRAAFTFSTLLGYNLHLWKYIMSLERPEGPEIGALRKSSEGLENSFKKFLTFWALRENCRQLPNCLDTCRRFLIFLDVAPFRSPLLWSADFQRFRPDSNRTLTGFQPNLVEVQCPPLLGWRHLPGADLREGGVSLQKIVNPLSYFAHPPEHFCEYFFRNCLGILYWQMPGIFGDFFLVSVSHETKHENSSKNSGKIRSKIRGKIRDENSKILSCFATVG